MSTQKPANSTVPTSPTNPTPVTFRPPGDSTGKGDGSGAVENTINADGKRPVLPVVGVESDILKPKISG